MILIGEIVLLFISGLLGEDWNLLVNSMISFACAMQVQSFRKWNGNVYASTMCIGNLRSGISALSAYLRVRNPAILHKAFYYFMVIFIFFLGAAAGFTLVKYIGLYAIWAACPALIIAVIIMHQRNKEKDLL